MAWKPGKMWGVNGMDTREHRDLKMIPEKLSRKCVCVCVCVLGKERLGMWQSAAWTVLAEYTRERLHEGSCFSTRTIRFLTIPTAVPNEKFGFA